MFILKWFMFILSLMLTLHCAIYTCFYTLPKGDCNIQKGIGPPQVFLQYGCPGLCYHYNILSFMTSSVLHDIPNELYGSCLLTYSLDLLPVDKIVIITVYRGIN